MAMISKQWMKAAAIRCIRTMAQSALAVIGSEALLTNVNWKQVVIVALLAGITSLLTSTAGLPEVGEEEA